MAAPFTVKAFSRLGKRRGGEGAGKRQKQAGDGGGDKDAKSHLSSQSTQVRGPPACAKAVILPTDFRNSEGATPAACSWFSPAPCSGHAKGEMAADKPLVPRLRPEDDPFQHASATGKDQGEVK
jgi:hypothetical protein